ncbi:MAG: heavy-metal-associated domain-containing protein [Planctomycetaceae bacterium]|nr:heavy-metal-associated domain-containing protein [Planctomycetaceae bacterium]
MTTSLQFKTNLNCGSCVAAVKPFLDDVPNISDWKVDTATPDRILTVHGHNVLLDSVTAAVAKAGFVATGDMRSVKNHSAAIEAAEVATAVTYYPLLLLATFLFGVVGLVELRIGTFDSTRAMQNFMGAFFGAFAFFKLLDLRGFADSYRMYDIVARRLPVYGYVYPFIELALGAAYIAGFQPTAVNLTTLAVMSVSSIGVIRSVLQKRKIRCACLGTVFNLPMSTVTLVEDGLMIAMAAAALLGIGH